MVVRDIWCPMGGEEVFEGVVTCPMCHRRVHVSSVRHVIRPHKQPRQHFPNGREPYGLSESEAIVEGKYVS